MSAPARVHRQKGDHHVRVSGFKNAGNVIRWSRSLGNDLIQVFSQPFVRHAAPHGIPLRARRKFDGVVRLAKMASERSAPPWFG